MVALRKNRLACLSTSFGSFLIAPLLVSIGTTGGPRLLSWGGFILLLLGASIPLLQRLLLAREPADAQKP